VDEAKPVQRSDSDQGFRHVKLVAEEVVICSTLLVRGPDEPESLGVLLRKPVQQIEAGRACNEDDQDMDQR
jgi:hypothetical protein